jgi:hypothetical protein
VKYFDIKDKTVVINNIALGIPCIKKLYEKMTDSGLFNKYVSYGIFITYFNSPHKSYSIEIRAKVLKRDLFGDENYNTAGELDSFVEELRNFSSTPSIRLLDAAEDAVDFLINEYKALRSMQGILDSKGKPIVSIGDVSKWLKELAPAVKSLETLKESVLKEEVAFSKNVRGQAEIGLYEDSLPS